MNTRDQNDPEALECLQGQVNALQAELAQLRAKAAMAEKLRSVGSVMANMMFNLKQSDRFTENERKYFEELQIAWDKARAALAEMEKQ